MWCDNCDYMPEEYEEKYMICPNCNTYIERNLPESPVKIQLVYNNSSKIIRLKKTISYILLPIVLINLVFNIFTILYFRSRYSYIRDSQIFEAFVDMYDSHYFAVGIVILMVVIPWNIFLYFAKRYDLSTFHNMIFIIITFISAIIFFKFFMDVVLPFFYNENISRLTAFISGVSDIKKYSNLIKTEVSFRTTYVFYSTLVLMIIIYLLFLLLVYTFNRFKTLQEELLEEFGD